MTNSFKKSCVVQAADYAASERKITLDAAIQSFEANRADAIKSGNFHAGEVNYKPTITPELEEAAKRYGFDHTQITDATYPQPPHLIAEGYIPEINYFELAEKAESSAYAVAYDRCTNDLPPAKGIKEAIKGR